jgi:hypothetical protein
MEVWAKVDWLGFDFDLEVSSLGRVRRAPLWYDTVSKRGTPCRSRKRERYYSQWIAKSGYPMIAIKFRGVRRKYLVHRLVAQAFVPGYAPDLSVNHINCNKQDNRAENLEWVTLAENTALQWRDGLVNLRGEANPKSKLSDAKVREIRRLLALGNMKKHHIAKQFGICDAMLLKIERRQAWAHVD